MGYLYLSGSIKAFLEHDTNTSEWRHYFPAGPQLTRSRDTMTLALHLHVVKDGLEVHGIENIYVTRVEIN